MCTSCNKASCDFFRHAFLSKGNKYFIDIQARSSYALFIRNNVLSNRFGWEEKPMVKQLTKKMHEVLKNADLARGEINNVPMSTLYGFEDRKLVTSEWRKGASRVITTTAGGTFPMYSKVKLTDSGLHEARLEKGFGLHL